MQFDSNAPIAMFCITGILSILFYKIIQILSNPLNAVPGPWWAKFTSLPATIATLSRRQVQYYHNLHQKYGSFVRVSPGQVFVSDVQSFKTIHRIGGHFKKADYYHFFGPTEAGSPPYGLFQMTDEADHAERRKLLGRGFTATSLRSEWEDMVRQKAFLAIDCMQKDAKLAGGEVDIRKWWVLFTSDVVSKLMFGVSFDGLTSGKRDTLFEEFDRVNFSAFFALSFPWLYVIAKRLPFVGSMRMFHAHKALLGKGRIAVANGKQAIGPQSANLFAKLLHQAEYGQTALTEDDICVEAASFIFAGTDTTSNTLTYLIWAVLSQPELQKALENELEQLLELFTDEQLERLPILQAVIEETLRLYGAAPTPLPRIVPNGGVQLGGFHLPAGTNVATQAYTAHRDPKIFHDPEKFDHTRWLDSEDFKIPEEFKASFTPFGAGSRVCIGKHLAYMEIRYGTAFFFRRFKGCRLVPASPESMEMANIMVVEPRGKVCWVVLPGSLDA